MNIYLYMNSNLEMCDRYIFINEHLWNWVLNDFYIHIIIFK
jgi:hypothetical protein